MTDKITVTTDEAIDRLESLIKEFRGLVEAFADMKGSADDLIALLDDTHFCEDCGVKAENKKERVEIGDGLEIDSEWIECPNCGKCWE